MWKIVFLAIVLPMKYANAQKKLVDFEFNRPDWITLKNGILSKDNNFIYYEYKNGNSDSDSSGAFVERINWVKLKSASGKKEYIVRNGRDPHFSSDSRFFICGLPGDSLLICDLKTDVIDTITHASEIQLSLSNGNSVLFYKEGDHHFVMYNLTKKEKKIVPFKSFERYEINKTYTAAVVCSIDGLFWVSLSDGKVHNITRPDQQIRQFCFDNSGMNLLFSQVLKGETTLRYYESLASKIRDIISDSDVVNDRELKIDAGSTLQFSTDDQTAFFYLKRSAPPVGKDVLTNKVDVWSFKDAFIPTHRWELSDATFSLKAAISIQPGSKLIQIETEDRTCQKLEPTVRKRYILTRSRTNTWDKQQASSYWLIDMKDDKSLSFIPKDHDPQEVWLSPNERFVVWRNGVRTFFYDINKHRIHEADIDSVYVDFNGWLDQDQSVLAVKFVDEFKGSSVSDVWQLSSDGTRASVNLTGGLGRQLKIRFGFASGGSQRIIRKGSKILLTAIDKTTKDGGFWWVSSWRAKSAERISMDNFLYDIKDYNGDAFLVTKESVDKYPNFYLTNDLKHFKQLTTYHPHESYQWLTAEVHHYPMRHGKIGTLVLYKPDNFDKNKAYPVIFNYYQYESDLFHKYGGNNVGLNIAYYVSRGYLVCKPDIINVEPAAIVDNTVNSLESALEYLGQFKWFNRKKLGLIGHSFGGYETNLLVANSNVFACAVSKSGIGNLVSLGGSLNFGGIDMWPWIKYGQPNMQESLWASGNSYIKNSPTFQADKINTPLLLIHGSKDLQVPFLQSVELFTALRQLNKTSWMLSYDDEDHVITGRDVELRTQQFFDHYLKDKPMPIWMSNGIPKRNKGFVSGLGYEPDTTTNKLKNGLSSNHRAESQKNK